MVEMNQGIVCIMDILGLRGIWTRENPEEVIEKWKKILENLKKNVSTFSEIIDEGKKIKRDINDYSFSDTIIMTISPYSFQSLLNMCGIVGDVFSIALDIGIMFRGAISLGAFYSSESDNILIGAAIDDAADWFEAADWAGIMLTPKASYYVDYSIMEGAKKNKINNLLTKYDVPLKNNTTLQDIWTVSWPTIFLKYDEIGKELSESKLKKNILEIFSRNPIGINHKNKYINTLNFFNHVFIDR
jgi:hypothetical protein